MKQHVKKIEGMELKEEDQRKKTLRKKPKKPSGFFENPTKPKKPDNDNEYDSDNDIDNDLLSKEEKEEKLEQRFESCLNSTNQESLKECKKYLNKLPFSVIDWVLVRTSGIKEPNWNYSKAILEDFIKRKIDTIGKIEEDQKRYKQEKREGKTKKVFFKQREYSQSVLDSLYANM